MANNQLGEKPDVNRIDFDIVGSNNNNGGNSGGNNNSGNNSTGTVDDLYEIIKSIGRTVTGEYIANSPDKNKKIANIIQDNLTLKLQQAGAIATSLAKSTVMGYTSPELYASYQDKASNYQTLINQLEVAKYKIYNGSEQDKKDGYQAIRNISNDLQTQKKEIALAQTFGYIAQAGVSLKNLLSATSELSNQNANLLDNITSLAVQYNNLLSDNKLKKDEVEQLQTTLESFFTRYNMPVKR